MVQISMLESLDIFRSLEEHEFGPTSTYQTRVYVNSFIRSVVAESLSTDREIHGASRGLSVFLSMDAASLEICPTFCRLRICWGTSTLANTYGTRCQHLAVVSATLNIPQNDIWKYVERFIGTHIRVYVDVFIHVQIYTHTYLYIYIHVQLHMYICTHMIYTYVYIYIYIHIQLHMYIYTHIYTHTYVYIYIHIHTHVHIYIYMQVMHRRILLMQGDKGALCHLEPGSKISPSAQTPSRSSR